MKLRAKDIIDPEIEGYYVFFPFVEHITTREHHHDFYEIFLIASGSIYHHINGENVLLTSGALVFIRPDDRHFYSPDADQNCELINFAFLSETLHRAITYLGVDHQNMAFLQATRPPITQLTISEKNQLVPQLKAWGRLIYRDKTQSRLVLRGLLGDVIATYFLARSDQFTIEIPLWLQEVCQQMRRKEHFIAGRDALMRLANRTPEYVGRSFKTYLGITPSQFINDLRLDLAADLLLYTDNPVIDICFEVGFENLSHFHHLFRARWGISPLQFRKQYRRDIIP